MFNYGIVVATKENALKDSKTPVNQTKNEIKDKKMPGNNKLRQSEIENIGLTE